jgi:hypothetical protein
MTSFLFLTHIFIGTFTNAIIGDRHIEHPPIHGSDGRHNLFFERLVEFHMYTFFIITINMLSTRHQELLNKS